MTAATIAAASASSVVGLDQPAGVRVVDDLGRAGAVDGDRRQLAGHRLDQDLAELLVDRGVDEDVAGAQEVGQVVVGVPAGEEDVGDAEALDRLDRVLALPLAGVAADQDQGRRGRRSAGGPAAKASISSGRRLTSVKRPT